MEEKEGLAALPKEALIELLGIYAKDWLAMDGVWFQAVERAWGMEAAMRCDVEIWERFTAIEAGKIKNSSVSPSGPVWMGWRRRSASGCTRGSTATRSAARETP